MEKQPLPSRLAKMISEYHKDGIREEDCKVCSSGCCSHGGFAILENVVRIYEKYKNAELRRKDYEFPEGLSFAEFVGKFFDVIGYNEKRLLSKKNIIVFYMRSISQNNETISIPYAGNYYNNRTSFFYSNPWLNKGCVFLNKKVPNWPEDDKDCSRMCILHTPDCNEKVTEKPIDCVFFTCTQPMKPKVPTQAISNQWFWDLATAFPNSHQRFQEMVNKDLAGKTDKEHIDNEQI